MASNEETAALRSRIGRLLKSKEVLAIQFMLDNVCVQRFMYTYMGQAILEDTVHLFIGNNPGYDPPTKMLELEGDASDATIVHESTHVLINATHKGKIVSKGTHETAAYLAEAVWSLNTDNEVSINIAVVEKYIRLLAKKIKESNDKGKLFVCPPDEVQHIQALLKGSALKMDIDHKEMQIGIGDGPKKTRVVEIKNNKFQPDSITIGVWDSIVWINTDPTQHTATSVKGTESVLAFDTGKVGSGQKSKRVEFKTLGRVKYSCEVKGTTMSGAIEVK